ncbi:helicase with zinc finger domain 2-like [Saccostrea cucullata]|uniref:helicase with zinc finger domain 2-like n=1 Tax=Saccostrea cuccullata TaxID=36930 RepID=UPI002ED4C82F
MSEESDPASESFSDDDLLEEYDEEVDYDQETTNYFYNKSLKHYRNEFLDDSGFSETLFSAGLDLSDGFVNDCFSTKVEMYDKMLDISESFERCAKYPETYKHCKIEIFNAHRAVCTTMDGEMEIEISGRSKCGKAFNEDEVVVEILHNDEHRNKIYGKVVCITKRNESIPEYPVFVCTMDDRFMIPVCKTVPKIYPLKEVFEGPRKPGVNVYKLNEITKKLIIDEVKFIDQSKRKEYTFLVCFIKWEGVYPIGAIIKVYDPKHNVETSLNLICLENKVSVLYKEKTIEKVGELERESDIRLEEKREDLTNLHVFTIDDKKSKDLDDALSIKEIADSHFEVGIHIADVGSIVKRDDDIDLEAQERSTTFNPGGNHRAYHMLPEPIATGLCSLLPFHKRKTLSVFFIIDGSGNIIDKRTEVKRTYVKSRRSFTYQEVQKLLTENESSDDAFKNTLIMLHDISKKIRYKRLGLKIFSIPFEQQFTESYYEYNKSLDARIMVEEYMIHANSFIAKFLHESFPDCIPLRTQSEPSPWKMEEWEENNPVFANFVLSLQNQNLPPNQLSIDNIHEYTISHQIPVQKYIWKKMNLEFSFGRYKNVQRLIGTDEFHPKQAMAYESWISFQKTAVYNCSGSCRHDGNHFSLGINPYVHFTSPIRRYADLMVGRLVHAKIDKKPSPYSQNEIDMLCRKINMCRNLEFKRQCQLLHLGRQLQEKPRLFHALAISATEKSLVVCFPGLRALSKTCNEIEFCLLKVSSKPFFGENGQRDHLLTLSWLQRLYSWREYLSSTPVSNGGSVNLNPHRKVNFVSIGRWKMFINAMINDSIHTLGENFDDGEVLPIVPECLETHLDAISEKHNDTIVQQYTEFSLSFDRGQVIPLQLGAEQKGGIVVPTIHLLEISKNVKCCIQHMSDPIECFAAYATRHAGNRPMTPDEYVKVWSEIFRMESITNASNSLSVVINHLPIRFCSSKIGYGFFVLNKTFCLQRDLNFQWEKTESDGKFVPFERNFLCIRCETQNGCPLEDSFNSPPNRRWIWVGHGETKFIQKDIINDEVTVQFQLHEKSRKPTLPMINATTCICTIEILQMSVSDRRIELNLNKLDKATNLAKSIALREEMPKLDDRHLNLGKLQDPNRFEEVLQPNNNKQSEAIKKALSSRFTLIQGPPGTGKTSTGIKLLLLFVNINLEYRKNSGDHKQVIYCGPSNKSVDLVARQLHLKLKTLCPNIVRMYGSSIENTVFPIPGREYINKTSKTDNRPDPDLADVSLHNVIRKDGKPYARELKQLDKLFQINPEGVDPEKIIKYMKILSKATQEELKHYDVIFCTTSVATNPKLLKATQGKVFQLIIDEAGMCTEPETIAPIIATKAEQVVLIGDHKQLQPIIICPEACRLGLSKSLFQRHSDNAVELKSQYRMNPKICEFPSKQFYKDKLNTESSKTWHTEKPLTLWRKWNIPLLFCHVEGEEKCLSVATEEGNEQSRSNLAEVELVIKVYTYLVNNEKLAPPTVRILTQYNAQRHAINEALKMEGFDNAEANTVVSSQGGEWDYVIFSTVRSLPDYRIEEHPTRGWCMQNLGFITDQHQINVALTRPRKGLIIIGNQQLLKCDGVWKELLKHYARQGCIVDSENLYQTIDGLARL